MAVVDDTIVTIALPSMRRELGFAGADAQWVLNGYALDVCCKVFMPTAP